MSLNATPGSGKVRDVPDQVLEPADVDLHLSTLPGAAGCPRIRAWDRGSSAPPLLAGPRRRPVAGRAAAGLPDASAASGRGPFDRPASADRRGRHCSRSAVRRSETPPARSDPTSRRSDRLRRAAARRGGRRRWIVVVDGGAMDGGAVVAAGSGGAGRLRVADGAPVPGWRLAVRRLRAPLVRCHCESRRRRPAGVSRREAGRAQPLADLGVAGLALLEQGQQRRGDEDRRVGTGGQADEQGQAEVLEGGGPERPRRR